jgi:hypothetical protein
MILWIIFSLFEIDPRCGKLIANALNKVLIGHHGLNLALPVEPILGVMLVSALVMEPGLATAVFISASGDRGAVTLIIFRALEKFGRRKL